jgi:hypothetical protein
VKHHQIILSGTVLFIVGCYLDQVLVRYAYLLIVVGSAITFFGSLHYLGVKENRIKVWSVLKPKGDFFEMLREAFNFQWERVSLIWTFCALVGMLIVNLGTLTVKSMGAYKSAVQYILVDEKVKARIGDVRDFTYMVSGHASTTGSSNLYFGVIGTKGSIEIRAVIESYNGNHITQFVEMLE